ncbi:hypothetical protein GCM10012280_25020 [Wenjunlia tyrosinilytica]|uniref:Uncharacterized protein n=1 Tax=Wenjunlia tyrosinilytica TaxID=1544741 RepID=A0A918DXM6_9ACTN|nr:hypothetical protein GCM10012280_25020 [Wenjunlia tyrosinilytica]
MPEAGRPDAGTAGSGAVSSDTVCAGLEVPHKSGRENWSVLRERRGCASFTRKLA